MEQINNDQTIKECSAVLGHQVDNIPMLDTSRISLVSNINPKDYRKTNIIKSATSATGLYTTPTDRDFFLLGISIHASNKTASQDSVSTVTGAPKGSVNSVLASLSYSTSSLIDVNQTYVERNFKYPILMERGISISLTSTNNNVIRGIIWGYTVDQN